MKHKTAELEGALLDFSVARLERGDTETLSDFGFWKRECWDAGVDRYSTDCAHGGPIIERERIATWPCDNGGWRAMPSVWGLCHSLDGEFGETQLQAAMRAYVASRFGDEVDLP